MRKPSLLAKSVIVLSLAMVLGASETSKQGLRQAAKKSFEEGNHRDAYAAYRQLALASDTEPDKVGPDLQAAVNCLMRLNRVDEIDAFREDVIKRHGKNWRLLHTAAQTYMNVVHHGYRVAGEFQRGNKRGGGEFISAFDRDRVRALQLMQRAFDLVADKEVEEEYEKHRFLLDFARYLLHGRGGQESWRLQYLSDLSTLPDYEAGGGYYGGSQKGAPVDENGNPIFHRLPESYTAATTDGERWRALLDLAVKTVPATKQAVQLEFVRFLHQQFGVQTMRYYGAYFGARATDDDELDTTGPYAVHTLAEDETIARLATGSKRFKLPDEFNYIRICRQIAEEVNDGNASQALEMLAPIFENRRQYPKAAEVWRASIARFGAGQNNRKQKRLDQIVKNWGRFETITVMPAGQAATAEFRFRNGSEVTFEAHRIRVTRLLDDAKAYLKSNPKKLDWNQLNIANVGRMLIDEKGERYLGEQVAQWKLALEPLDAHFDKQITVTTPLRDAGAYLLTAKMADGNTSRIVVWIDDTVIVRKPLGDRWLYFVAHAVTGQPVAGANLEFFGHRQVRKGRNQHVVLTSQFAESTDENGQAIPSEKLLLKNFHWLVIARSKDGRFAHLGFNNVWYGHRSDQTFDQTKAFVVTDRPVYRPEQSAKFKFWIRTARYDQKDVSVFAKRSFKVRVANPKGESVQEKSYTTDEFGGFEGEFPIPGDAVLGQYAVRIINESHISGGGSFRVEEYKKPEFEVTVEAPDKPVSLGEKITATVRAKYYFGAPVTNAKVHYKVERTNHSSRWFPIGKWDWLYGSGYWWFASDYSWYPGWRHWGCLSPIRLWWPRRSDPPEVVLDDEVEIGEDGTVAIEIDTALAKQLHGDEDHRYSITAEVVDRSRRTIVGKGQVLVARAPFKVFAWTNRGHYRTGDVIKASFKAQTLDRKPVKGTGQLTLYRVSYDENAEPAEPVETEVESWELDTNERGEAEHDFKTIEPGQYRLSYNVTDGEGHTIEGGYLFIVTGEGFDGGDLRFDDLELITEKREYAPGETVRVLINTRRAGSTVVLFVRAAGGLYPRPQILRLDGKSAVHEVTVVKADMPNFFIEAFTVSGGKIYSKVREVVVPPEKRIVNVAVLPSAGEYKPGAESTVKLKLTDLNGDPISGSTVVSVYDKSVEYISGGSNVPEVRAFFWNWRRSHHPRTESTLTRRFANLLKAGETPMGTPGAFGQAMNFGHQWRMRGGQRSGAMFGGGHFGNSSRLPASGERMYFSADAAAPMGAKSESATLQEEGGQAGEIVQPTIRKEFADTALWVGSLLADENGLAEVALTMPDNLTTWMVRAWAMGHGTRVGQGQAEVITTKNLLVRMQAPRFFTETDEVVLSANVHNYLESAKQTQVVLELDGDALEPLDDPTKTVTIEANGEARIDWRIRVRQAGEAIVRMKALTDEESDATEMRFPVNVHGMQKTESFAGTIRPDKDRSRFEITVPEKRRVAQTRLEVRYSPSLAGALVDALPYLVSYPHKTTDTTLTRFLPTVITQNILKRMNLDLEDIREKRTNLNAQEIGDAGERAAGWKRYDENPVFDEAEVKVMVQQGLRDLTERQLSDGGWGWFSGWRERSDAHITAQTVHGLQIAQENSIALVPGVLEKGVAWLTRYQAEQLKLRKSGAKKNRRKNERYKLRTDNLDALVFMVLVDADVVDGEMRDFLYQDRNTLSVYAKALLGLALHHIGDGEKLAMIVRNIDQYLVQDDENQTAYLKLPQNHYWWYWYGSETEANAYYLKLLSRTDPQGEKAPKLVKYLLNNRKHSTYWRSTRDTALAVEAMAEYIQASGEDQPDMIVAVYYDGKKQKEITINAANFFSFDNKIVLEGDAIQSGVHSVELRKKGTGPLYYSADLSTFTLEDHITRAGLEVKVNRKYYRLIRDDKQVKVAGSRGQSLDQRVEKYRREELVNFAELKSGELIEVELEIDSKNDYEYLVFEDMKAAGFEPVELQSGYSGKGLGAYVEYRDERVTFFARRLARGKHSLAYRLRAEIPGRFSALPTKGYAMYAPELKGNSDELKLSIVDAP